MNETLEENQGLSTQFNSPNAIFIYSVGDWIAQKYHSPLAGHKPTAAQNKFGTDQVGFLGLGNIDGVSPIINAKVPTINTAFKSTGFTRTLYDIVRYAGGDHIPADLDRSVPQGLLLQQQDRHQGDRELRLPAGTDLRQRSRNRSVRNLRWPARVIGAGSNTCGLFHLTRPHK